MQLADENSPAPRGSASDGRLMRMRMYNVGFGDAFLLFIPTDEGERTVLVDCGVHPAGVTNRISSVVEDILATCTVNGRPRLDVVVATHRHADHISGFALRAWRDVEVGEVWLPWTEDRSNPAARRIREAQNRFAAALKDRFPSTASAPGWLAANSLSNAEAERTLLHGFASCEVWRYLPHIDRSKRTFASPALPGVTIHALGPSHDPALIASLDPPAGSYFPASGSTAGDSQTRADPLPDLFARPFCVPTAEYAKHFPWLAEHANAEDLRERVTVDFLAAATSLEDAINGTSLVLALEISDRTVLLAGDAEWGTWSEILADDAWREILSRTSLYKVSHHGSYNGTPPQFVDELMPSNAVSLVSLRTMKFWPSIPRESLLAALGSDERTLIRSNELPKPDNMIRRNDDLWVEILLPIDT
jgi:beta-lactamase superfamily II metal-dependent hydrolase